MLRWTSTSEIRRSQVHQGVAKYTFLSVSSIMTARPPIGALSEGIEICSTSQSSACKLEPSNRFFGQRLSLHRSCSRRRRPFRAQTELLVARKVCWQLFTKVSLFPDWMVLALTRVQGEGREILSDAVMQCVMHSVVYSNGSLSTECLLLAS